MRFMKSLVVLLSALTFSISCSSGDHDEAVAGLPKRSDYIALTDDGATRFARLALDCMHREYPNKLNQVLSDEKQLLPPKVLHPAFFGCFDWHSSVHGHWMLAKLLREFPELLERQQIIDGLSLSLSPDNIAGEVAYFVVESASWERTYGWAWLLQLATELKQWDDPLGQQWAVSLEPLTQMIRDRFIEFLPRQEYPIRTGVHPNTAFGLSFAFDYAETVADDKLMDAIVSAAKRYYAADKDCPLSWEPSGEDFLSPCLEEAALMARVLPDTQYSEWLAAFLPSLADRNSLPPANVSDRSDPKIVHLDGLNLSRAWNLYVIANELEDVHAAAQLREKAAEHLAATLPQVTSEHYEGSHWLGSFAIYALTREN